MQVGLKKSLDEQDSPQHFLPYSPKVNEAIIKTDKNNTTPKKKKELPKRKSSEKFPLKELLERQQSALMNNQIISIAVKSLKQLDTKKNARLESIKEDSTHNLIAT